MSPNALTVCVRDKRILFLQYDFLRTDEDKTNLFILFVWDWSVNRHRNMHTQIVYGRDVAV